MGRDAAVPAWAGRVAAAEGPVYLAVADAIGAAIAAGELKGGERLPTHRALAAALGVDLTTVTRAYAIARERGLLQATVGRGTFVHAPDATPAGMAGEGPVDLGMNLPPIPAEPKLEALIERGIAGLLAGARSAGLLNYRSGCGTPQERAAGAHWLRPTLGEVDAQRLLVCAGAQAALFAVLAELAQPGEAVLTDVLTYPGLRAAAARLGIRLVGVAGDGEGMLPDAVAAACRRVAPKAIYCVPTIHNPTAATMPVARREALAAVARRHGVAIVEDDAYGLLPSQPIPAIAALAPDIAFHVATVSKVISPALRVAYLVAPDTRWAARLTTALRAAVLMASPLLTELMTAWVREGTAGAIQAAIRRESAARQEIARQMLPAGAFDAHAEGLHVWLRLPAPWERRAFVAHLQRHGGLAVVPSDAFAVDGGADLPDGVRVSLGAAPNREALRRALGLVAAALRAEAQPDYADIV